MVSNTQSTESDHCPVGPPISLEDEASICPPCKCILIMIPIPIQVDGHIVNRATTASDLPPTSNESSAQYFAFVRQITIRSVTSHLLEIYLVLSFTIGTND
jgi:hypothetical protein